MNSMNHYSYGSIVEWIYAYAAGIQPLSPGFLHIKLTPRLDVRMKHLNCQLESVSGTYNVNWNIIDSHHVQMHIEIPYACKAEVTLPSFKSSQNKVSQKMTLTQGTYDFTYETDHNLNGEITLQSEVAEALKNPDIRQYLETIPLFAQSEFSFGSRSIKEAIMSTCNCTEEEMTNIERKLSKLQN